jgi:hypothetical protein
MLMKFQNRDKLEMLQDGLMYMKPLQFYIDLEKKSLKKFIADDLEAQARTVFQTIQIFSNDDNSLFLEGTNGLSTLSLGYESNPVFCMFSFDMRNCNDEKLNGDKLEYRMAFTNEQKAELKEFGDSVLVIKNNGEFFKRVESAFEKRNVSYERNHVLYYKEDSPQHLKNIIDGVNHIAFSKREEYFSVQQEYRFLADATTDDAFILDIGDIRDISEIYPIDEVLEKEFRAVLTLR